MSDRRLDLVEGDIASWVQRETDAGRVLTRQHYIQSIIGGGAITYCGLRMRRATGRPFRLLDRPSDPCANCPPVSEADGSTQNVSASLPLTGTTTVLSTTNKSVTL